MFRCNCHWGRLCLWIPSWNSKIVMIYPNGSRFLILLLRRHRLSSQQWGPVSTEACFVDSWARTSLLQGEPWCLKAQIFPVRARWYLPTGLKSTLSLLLHLRKNKRFSLSVLQIHPVLCCGLEQWTALAHPGGTARAGPLQAHTEDLSVPWVW